MSDFSGMAAALWFFGNTALWSVDGAHPPDLELSPPTLGLHLNCSTLLPVTERGE